MLTEPGATGPVVMAVNGAGLHQGLGVGMTLTNARALAPNVVVRAGDRRGDALGLTRLALWAQRFSPWTRGHAHDGLALDITGCAAVFGGEHGLVASLSQGLTGLGGAHQIGLADTLIQAQALARCAPHWAQQGANVWSAAPGEAASFGALPIDALDLPTDVTSDLHRFGLHTVDRARALDPRALAQRFSPTQGRRLLACLDEMFGRAQAPFEPVVRPPQFAARRVFDDPLQTSEGLIANVTHLIDTMSAQLVEAGRGALRMRLRVFRTDAGVCAVRAQACRPSHEAHHWRDVFRERLGVLDCGLGVDALVLEATHTARLTHETRRLTRLETASSTTDALARLADRLSARYGGDAVRTARAGGSWLPERADCEHPLHAMPGLSDWPRALRPAHTGGPRPARLFETPETAQVTALIPDGPPLQFTWRRRLHRVMRSDGPERIAPEWWRHVGSMPAPQARDYYVVETAEGARLWLFREGQYVDGDDGPGPRWRVHGVFA